MRPVCCLIDDAETVDLLAEQYRALQPEVREKFPLDIIPPGSPPGGFYWYVSHWSGLEALLAGHAVHPWQVVAYGPVARMAYAFDCGVRDYLREPWDLTELLARVERCISQSGWRFSWGHLEACGGGCRLDGQQLEVPAAACRMLAALAERAGMLVHRRDLARLAGIGNPSGRSVDVYAGLIRTEIRRISGWPVTVLETVRGRGFRLYP